MSRRINLLAIIWTFGGGDALFMVLKLVRVFAL